MGPKNTAPTPGLSLVGSTRTVIGSRTESASPAAQVRVTDAYDPGAAATSSAAPFRASEAPVAQAGMRTRTVQDPDGLPPIVRVEVSPTGYVVAWVTVTLRAAHVRVDGMNRLTVSVVPS